MIIPLSIPSNLSPSHLICKPGDDLASIVNKAKDNDTIEMINGTYVIKTPIKIERKNLYGHGSIIKGTGFKVGRNAFVKDLKFVGNNKESGSVAITCGTGENDVCARSVIENISIVGYDVGISLNNCWIVSFNNLFINGCNAGIKFAGKNVDDVRFGDGALEGCEKGLVVTGNTHLGNTIDDYAIEACGIGISIEGSCQAFRIQNCYFEGNTASDINIDNWDCLAARLHQNYHLRGTSPVVITKGQDILVSDCIFRSSRSIIAEKGVLRLKAVNNYYTSGEPTLPS